MATLTLPDTTTSLPALGFEFAPAARSQARALLGAGPALALTRLLRDQESPAGLLAARIVLDAFLRAAVPQEAADADAVAGQVLAVRAELLSGLPAPTALTSDARDAVLRQRAPLGLLAGCWLDVVSQPATQPAAVVNSLLTNHFALQGEGNPRDSVHHTRQRTLERAGVFLPDIDAEDFLAAARARPLTAVHGLFYLSLSRLPVSFLPEVVGVHYAFGALGIDDALLELAPRVDEPTLRAVLAEYLRLTEDSPTGEQDRRRLAVAVALVCALEREHVAMLAELARFETDLPLEARVVAVIERHAPFAGRQHREVRVSGQRLIDVFGDPDFDPVAFVRMFRGSRQLKPIHDGDGRFLRAIKFGGPMFGIFDQREADLFARWQRAAVAGELTDAELPVNRVGDEAAQSWAAAIEASDPADVRFAEPQARDDRELFHRSVNIEAYPNTLTLARARADANLAAAEVLFDVGAAGRYTDASWFDYTPEALLARVESIYWEKLVNPYRPLTEIPDRDEVIFVQKTYALGSLIDGAWAHRIGNVGRNRRASDGMLASIYADEMGRGDLRKNHITLIVQVLRSMGIELPHIRDEAFLQQGELPDHLYGFAVHQACLALFPDSLYNEILGYNLGIEMFGLGEMRMHEAQKLRHHGFDPVYEEAHLSIDNFSAGHARQSADIIVSYLDDVARTVGPGVVADEWRRIWRGYASFAYFVEHALVREATTARAATSELVI